MQDILPRHVHLLVYLPSVIQSFADAITEKLFFGEELNRKEANSLGIPGDLLIRLQAQFDFQKNHHARRGALRKQVRVIA